MTELTVSPDQGTVGTKVTVSGSGLEANKEYALRLEGRTVAVFTSTSRGTAPSRLRFSVPEMPTKGEKGEKGTVLKLEGSPKQKGPPSASADFRLLASVTAGVPSAYLGSQVSAEGHGLLAGGNYKVVLLSVQYTGFPVGVLDADEEGKGSAKFVVPGYIPPGPYRLDLMNTKAEYPAIENKPLIAIPGHSPESLVASSPKGPTKTSACPALISLPMRNTTKTSIMPLVYAIIYTKKRKPVQITSSTVGIAAESSKDVSFCFSNLPPGDYVIDAFAVTTSGYVISKAYSFPLTI